MAKQNAALVTIGSVTKQSSNGRITFPLSVALDDKSLAALPDWVTDAYDAVSKSFTKVSPEIKAVPGITLAFTGDKPSAELFKNPKAKIKDAELKGFSVLRTGDPDDPEVELHFTAYCPFNREFWAWLGEMSGSKVYMHFPTELQTAMVPGAQQETLTGLDAAQEPAKAPGDAKIVVVPPAKSGPKDLAAEHAKQTASAKPN